MSFSLFFALAVQAQSAGSAIPSTPAPEQLRDAITARASSVVTHLDDSIPLPVPAVYAAGDAGDTLVAPASGDPFFLGFAAGAHYPPAGERIDPQLTLLANSIPRDGRPTAATYAFVMFSKRMTPARVAELASLGVRAIEFHPFYTLKVAIPPRAIDAVAALDYVRWIGVERSWQKFHPDLTTKLGSANAGEMLAVYVNVFESDLCADSVTEVVAQAVESDPDGHVKPGNPDAAATVVRSHGWQQRALESLGVEVGPWVESIRAFTARVPAERFEEVAALDFVQFLDLDVAPSNDHDEGMPLSNADRVRASYDGSTSGVCQAGIIDTGMDAGHAAIDPYGVGWDYSGAGNAFDDTDGHGTHTAGTLLGNGDVDDSYQGGAPGLGSAQNRRVFVIRRGGNAPFSTWLANMHSSYFDGTYVSPAPMVVSNSYSGNVSGSAFVGSESSPRTIDAEAFTNDQLWIWSASNEGPTAGTIGLESCAKNAITVGNVLDYAASGVGDPGTIWDGSSRGPCGDGRWKPNVCAAGQVLYSCQAGTTTGYVNKGGTSMSTPLVSSIAAQLCDHYSFLRYNPACLSAVLMAGAITKDDALLTSPGGSAAHLNAYGTGRVDSYKANYGDSQQALYFWSFDPTWSNGYTELDFPVSSGATRLTVAFHYKETACSAGASQALVNNLDMYLDAEPFTGSNNTGDYFSHQSDVDNSEVRILNNPTVGNWKVKLYPTSLPPFQSVRAGVCVIVTYGDTTPTPTFNVTANDSYVQPGDDVTLTASYSNPSYIASAVYLNQSSIGDVLQDSYNTMADGSTADLMHNVTGGRDVCIGDVVHGTTRTHHWTTRWNTEGIKTFNVQARSDNAADVSDGATVYVDGTPPANATNLHSTTHTPNVWTNDTSITYAWNAALDNVSGIDGYGVFTAASPGLPSASKDIEQVTSYSETLTQGTWYFCLRAVDNSGNWNASYVNTGPFKIDTTVPSVPSGVSSSTHQVNVQSCSSSVTVNWTASTDNGGSGLAGYVGVWNTSAVTVPVGAPNIAAGATSYATDIGSSPLARYFHLRALDNAGNYGTTVHFGPIYANANSVSVYCTGKTNSLGCVPAIGTNGLQPSKSAGNFTVTCSNVIGQKNGLLFWGFTPSTTPFQGGIKCVASPTLRTPNQSSGGAAGACNGAYSFTFDTGYMSANSVDPGDTVYAQWWMRDPAIASTTGLSNAVQFTVCQ